MAAKDDKVLGNDIVENVVEEARKTARRLGKEREVLFKQIKEQVVDGVEAAVEKGRKLAKNYPRETILSVFAGGIILGAILFSRRGSKAEPAVE